MEDARLVLESAGKDMCLDNEVLKKKRTEDAEVMENLRTTVATSDTEKAALETDNAWHHSQLAAKKTI